METINRITETTMLDDLGLPLDLEVIHVDGLSSEQLQQLVDAEVGAKKMTNLLGSLNTAANLVFVAGVLGVGWQLYKAIAAETAGKTKSAEDHKRVLADLEKAAKAAATPATEAKSHD